MIMSVVPGYSHGLPQGADYLRILPEIVLSVFGMIVMFLEPLLDEETGQKLLGLIALLGALAGLAATWFMAQSPGLAFWNMLKVDGFSVFFHVLVIAIAAIAILSSYEYLAVQRIRAGEYYALILFGVVGMALMSSAIELVLIFVALEISSISSYVLAGFRRHEAASAESSLKYFLLGSFATAFFLYGVALMFGATGSTNIDQIGSTLRTGPVPLMAFVAVALMFVGLGFKVAAAPFHIWTPDVYEGAPAPVVGFMSTAPKAAAFAVLLRVVFVIDVHGLVWVIWLAAALSMTLGNMGALVQDNVKRLLAYSAIAHAGYTLVAFAAAPALGTSAAMFYLASYAAMNLGAFAVVSHFANAGERYVTLEDYARPGPQLSPAGGYAHHLFALTDRDPDDWRIFCQVLRVQCGGESQLDLAHHHRRGQWRRRSVLLPAHHRDDVYARIAEGSAGHSGSVRARSRASVLPCRDYLPRRFPQRCVAICSRLRATTRPAGCAGDSLVHSRFNGSRKNLKASPDLYQRRSSSTPKFNRDRVPGERKAQAREGRLWADRSAFG